MEKGRQAAGAWTATDGSGQNTRSTKQPRPRRLLFFYGQRREAPLNGRGAPPPSRGQWGAVPLTAGHPPTKAPKPAAAASPYLTAAGDYCQSTAFMVAREPVNLRAIPPPSSASRPWRRRPRARSRRSPRARAPRYGCRWEPRPFGHRYGRSPSASPPSPRTNAKAEGGGAADNRSMSLTAPPKRGRWRWWRSCWRRWPSGPETPNAVAVVWRIATG